MTKNEALRDLQTECVWKWSGPSDQVYLTGCGERQAWKFPYCPYCGGKVVIEELAKVTRELERERDDLNMEVAHYRGLFDTAENEGETAGFLDAMEEIRLLVSENARLRAVLQGVRDWIKAEANSDGGTVAHIDLTLEEQSE